jgi:hypothetical protein
MQHYYIIKPDFNLKTVQNIDNNVLFGNKKCRILVE